MLQQPSLFIVTTAKYNNITRDLIQNVSDSVTMQIQQTRCLIGFQCHQVILYVLENFMLIMIFNFSFSEVKMLKKNIEMLIYNI